MHKKVDNNERQLLIKVANQIKLEHSRKVIATGELRDNKIGDQTEFHFFRFREHKKKWRMVLLQYHVERGKNKWKRC